MRGGGLSKLIGFYLAIGGLWCFLSNAGAAITGAPSAFVVVTGSASASVKMIAVLKIVTSQILLWPMDVYDKVGRIVFG